MKQRTFIIVSFLMFFSAALSAQSSKKKLENLFARYYEQECFFNPLQATADGIHTYDDQLQNDGSSEFRAAKTIFYRACLRDLRQFNRSKLTEADRISYDILEYTLQTNLEGLALHLEYLPFNQFTASVPLDLALFGSGSGPQPFHTPEDYRKWSKRMIAFSDWVDTAIANFGKGKRHGVVLPKALVVKMIPQLTELAEKDSAKSVFYEPLRHFPAAFSEAEKQALRALYSQVVPQYVLRSYEKLAKYLENDYLPFAQDQPGLHALTGGDGMYRYFIKQYTTNADLTAEQVYQTGLEEVDRITREMEQNKRATGFSGTLPEYFHFLRTDKRFRPFTSPEQVLDAYRGIYKKIGPHLHELFHHRPKTEFIIKRVDAYREASQAGPFYIKGNYKENRPGIFFVPIPDANKVSTVFYGMECTFIHEAVPGHHYQISLQQEYGDLPAFQRQNALYAYMEGWALYCESLGEKLGCYTDPYQKMGALNNEIHRAIRLVVDVGIHTGKLSKQEAIAYMMAHESISETTATAEVERYMAWPGQALSYKIGELRIKALRDKYSRLQGKRFSLPDFHDAIIKYGCMPLDVLEKYLDAWNNRIISDA
ncbi:DUF885 domain-containing protein [Chitinophaga rhizosphaerae]|uniref:DUF885 domain-containing protein n=1 Tax=Chitinophaga rhizosphaerae TaxID=1864947 RepID=UPI000F7FFDA5|nr:DUF885 domain-containing protein [Chitinophaga rhizosphaerae]